MEIPGLFKLCHDKISNVLHGDYGSLFGQDLIQTISKVTYQDGLANLLSLLDGYQMVEDGIRLYHDLQTVKKLVTSTLVGCKQQLQIVCIPQSFWLQRCFHCSSQCGIHGCKSLFDYRILKKNTAKMERLFICYPHGGYAINNCCCNVHCSCQDDKCLQRRQVLITFRNGTFPFLASKIQPEKVFLPSTLCPRNANKCLEPRFLTNFFFPRRLLEYFLSSPLRNCLPKLSWRLLMLQSHRSPEVVIRNSTQDGHHTNNSRNSAQEGHNTNNSRNSAQDGHHTNTSRNSTQVEHNTNNSRNSTQEGHHTNRSRNSTQVEHNTNNSRNSAQEGHHTNNSRNSTQEEHHTNHSRNSTQVEHNTNHSRNSTQEEHHTKLSRKSTQEEHHTNHSRNYPIPVYTHIHTNNYLPVHLPKCIKLTQCILRPHQRICHYRLSNRSTRENNVRNEGFRIKSLIDTPKMISVKTEILETNVDDKFNILSLLKMYKPGEETFKDTFRNKTDNFMDNPSDFLPCHAYTNIRVNMLRNSAHGIAWRLFEKETLRMASFAHYPASAVKSATLLASSGFVYIGDGTSDKVKCFFCSAEKESWQEGDDIDQVHMSLNPSCPMVIVQSSNNVASGTFTPNVNDIADFSSAVPCSEGAHMSRPVNPDNCGERGRNNTAMPGSFTRETPSQAGRRPQPRGVDVSDSTAESQVNTSNFSSNTGRTTNTQVHSTPGLPQIQRSTMTPTSGFPTNNLPQSDINHSANETNQNTQNVEINSTRNQVQQLSNSIDEPHVPPHPNINSQIYSIPARSTNSSASGSSSSTPATSESAPATSESAPAMSDQTPELTYQQLGIFHERPKYIEYAVLARRLQTFEGWPEEYPMKKEELAKCGLFFAGYGDCCRCFFCGGGLRNWEKEDNPLVEHARWFGQCSFLRQYVGEDFVNAVQALAASENKAITLANVTQYLKSMGHSECNTFDRKITDDPAVKSVIQAGYDTEMVIRAAKSLKQTGESLSADAILQTIREETLGAGAAAEGMQDEVESRLSRLDEERLQTLKEENCALRNNLICKICMDKEIRVVFLPCGHLVSCQECAIALQDCPVCRKHIRATTRANIN